MLPPTRRFGTTVIALHRYFEEHPSAVGGLEADALRLRLEACDPGALVECAVDCARGRAAMRKALVYAGGAATAHVIADPRRVLQVLAALVEHDLDLARPEGEVVVSTRLVEPYVRFVVTSSPNGWLPPRVASVFDQYHVDAGGEFTGELYNCRQIIRAHGGHASVLAILGGQSTSWFTIPMARC